MCLHVYDKKSKQHFPTTAATRTYTYYYNPRTVAYTFAHTRITHYYIIIIVYYSAPRERNDPPRLTRV